MMGLFNLSEKAYLLLANGKIFEGYSFGKKGTVFGEVIFTTAMTGYQEIITDPSNYGCIVTQTFPLIGNYGVNDDDYESDKAHLNGYIVREWCNTPSNFTSQGDINQFLIKHGIVGLHSIDTRCLTRIIRDSGAMNGVITTENVYEKKEELLEALKKYKIKAGNMFTQDKITHIKTGNARYKVAVINFGCKRNIINQLQALGLDVLLVPAKITADEIKLLDVDGILLSNGAGDPAENIEIINNLKDISKLGIPIFGLCLGHQILAIANGAKTEKMKYGHRGVNQSVLDLKLERTFVTNQNHGYVVLNDSIDTNIADISHINANDKTCEGIRYKNIPALTVQFYPEKRGGLLDTMYLYNEFIGMMKNRRV